MRTVFQDGVGVRDGVFDTAVAGHAIDKVRQGPQDQADKKSAGNGLVFFAKTP